MKAKTFFLGVTTGLVGGIVAAFLTAPQSGNELRSTIAQNVKTTKMNLNDLKRQILIVKNSVSHLKNEAKNNIPKIISELKDNISQFSKEIEPEATKLKQEIEGLQNTIAEIENNLKEISKK